MLAAPVRHAHQSNLAAQLHPGCAGFKLGLQDWVGVAAVRVGHSKPRCIRSISAPYSPVFQQLCCGLDLQGCKGSVLLCFGVKDSPLHPGNG